MKIGFDAKRAFMNSSGLGNYSRNTLNALHRFFPEHDYTLFTPEIKPGLFENFQRFKVVAPQNQVAKKFKSLWRSLFLVPHLKRHHVNIFHGLSNELPRGIHKSDIPSVVTIHDLIFMRYPEFYKPIDRKIFFKKAKYACAASTKIIAISRQTQNDIETFFQVPPGKIELIYQPVAPVFFERQNTTEIQKKYHLPEEYMLAVGTLEPRKNQLTLLRALLAAKIQIPVILAGKPTSPYISEIKQFISENDLENQVTFLSNLPEKDLAGLYQKATLSVYISVFEGFGLPVIEAMASGCPVITSKVSVLPETAGEAAVLVNPANVEEIGTKISSLLGDEPARKEMIQKGLARAALFHPENYAKKLISLYNGILSKQNA